MMSTPIDLLTILDALVGAGKSMRTSLLFFGIGLAAVFLIGKVIEKGVPKNIVDKMSQIDGTEALEFIDTLADNGDFIISVLRTFLAGRVPNAAIEWIVTNAPKVFDWLQGGTAMIKNLYRLAGKVRG